MRYDIEKLLEAGPDSDEARELAYYLWDKDPLCIENPYLHIVSLAIRLDSTGPFHFAVEQLLADSDADWNETDWTGYDDWLNEKNSFYLF